VKTTLAIVAALLVCAAMFLLPHHKREAGKFQTGAFTLLDIFRDMLDSLGDLQSPRAIVFAMLSVASLLLVFWPVLLVLIVRLTRGEPGPVTGPLLLMGGVATVAAAAVNFLMMVFSQTSIGFGGGHANARPTALIWVVPVIQVASGIAGAIAVFSPAALARLLAALV